MPTHAITSYIFLQSEHLCMVCFHFVWLTMLLVQCGFVFTNFCPKVLKSNKLFTFLFVFYNCAFLSLSAWNWNAKNWPKRRPKFSGNTSCTTRCLMASTLRCTSRWDPDDANKMHPFQAQCIRVKTLSGNEPEVTFLCVAGKSKFLVWAFIDGHPVKILKLL